jgi:hypothetical protein
MIIDLEIQKTVGIINLDETEDDLDLEGIIVRIAILETTRIVVPTIVQNKKTNQIQRLKTEAISFCFFAFHQDV